jgi:glycosyltransferase involved in cell wall biosynthesis
MTAAPTASIVIATYNRSYVLRYAIASVLRSDFSDFEVIVVGDGCSDDTEEVVRGFADPRIRFVNLPTNSGAQSVPNNAGVALARGRYILFLNHDDLYFADHIGASIAFLERAGADIAWSPALVLEQSGCESGPPDAERDVIGLHGAVGDSGFDPQSFIIASSWIARADICRAVGTWRAPETTRLSPSQEWLFRAHRQGRRLAYHRHISMLCIYGGTRKHSYLIRSSPEHERAWTWITGGDADRGALLACATLEQAAQSKNNRDWVMRFRAEGRFPRPRKLAVNVLRRLGVHPVAVERLFEGTAKGDWIAQIRRFTGEAPALAPGQILHVGTSVAEPYLGRGWHRGEGNGRWTATGTAEILFSVAADSREAFVVELAGHPLRLPETVAFALNGTPALSYRFDAPETVVRMPLPGVGAFWLTITVPAPTSPFSLTGAPDPRTLGFWVSELRLTALSETKITAPA